MSGTASAELVRVIQDSVAENRIRLTRINMLRIRRILCGAAIGRQLDGRRPPRLGCPYRIFHPTWARWELTC